MAIINSNRIEIDKDYINQKSGALNALACASSEYIYKVIENYERKNNFRIKWFDKEKQKKLRRTVIHKNAHLDEYFAELLFRAILPPHLKDIEVNEHVLMSKDDDFYAKSSWPTGVVFGIRSDEAGGAKALQFFDEHINDGTRSMSSCSQMVAEDFLGNQIPPSIKKFLEEVNYSDSYAGAHQYHLKNVLFALNNVFFLVGKNEIDNSFVNKLLPENWRRALADACICSFVYAFENKILLGYPSTWSDEFKTKIETFSRESLDKFFKRTYVSQFKPEYYNRAKGRIQTHFRIWYKKDSGDKNYHNTINGSLWKDKKTKKSIESQALLIQPLCYAVYQCWGNNIGDFIMFQIWQSIIQLQTAFEEIKDEINNLQNFKKVNGISNEIATCFGTISRHDIEVRTFKPQKKETDDTRRLLEHISHFHIYYASVSNPYYSNVKQVLTNILNERNGGFGIILIETKSINSKAITKGTSMPYEVWKLLSDKITSLEPESWFQLQPDGEYADFILNRTEAHQDQLPSIKIDISFLLSYFNEL